ncbi:MAG: hypothetical protein HPY30_12375 [Gammaproteobacteria bacterium (ex Lamellibrachia satsuma)]|nr:MAG: hypothetical protein HPY30_12375 [Gammaproteobacteria bacterium (ex Lamellibrachia satsuma)]
MPMKDWCLADDYGFTEKLSGAQWAWEFLRRNPDYRREWKIFNETWQLLEAAYGRPPNRDFCAWKLDPRSWVAASECSESDCRIEGDKVLIECAMGARWGFYKFPPDPVDDDPVGEERLAWREFSIPPRLLEEPGDEWRAEQAAILFDLAIPLLEQLAQAKRRLQIEQSRRIKAGKIVAPKVSAQRVLWRLWLRLLDAVESGAKNEMMAQQLNLEDLEELAEALSAANSMMDGAYRRCSLYSG